MERVTIGDLEAVCRRINRAVTGEHEREDFPTWQIAAPELPGSAGRPARQLPGVYHLSGAYGGYALHLTAQPDSTGESHGVTDVFGRGHIPKRELYDAMQAFLRGMDAQVLRR